MTPRGAKGTEAQRFYRVRVNRSIGALAIAFVTCKLQYVNRAEFEHQVLTLWMTTRVPLTRANLQFVTKVERKQLERWLDEMLQSGTLEFDSDEKGELL